MRRRLTIVMLLAAMLPCFVQPGGAAAATSVHIDLGSEGSRVQPGWTAWNLPAGHHWNHRGPFELAVPPTRFDPDGFTMVLGPDDGIGYRAGPACKGPHAAVIAENIFCWSDRPMYLRISGLSSGAYRVITWHNDSRGYVRPPVDLLVSDAAGNGEPAVFSVPQTGVAESHAASKADFPIRSNGTDDIVIRTRVPVDPHVYVSLNAVEILAGEDVYRAMYPNPPDGAVGLSVSPELSWSLPSGTPARRLLVGKSPDALQELSAGVSPPYECPALPPGATIFWRVEAGPDDANLVVGPIWSFTVQAGQARTPIPADGAVDVAPAALLRWTPASGSPRHRIWMGRTPDALVRVADDLAAPQFTAELEIGETWYWRVDEVFPHATVKGEVWTFTTDDLTVKNPYPPDDAQSIPPFTTLSWRPRPDTDAVYTVRAGPSADHLQPLFSDTQENTLHAAFTPGTEVFWRVDADYDDTTVRGTLWHFTTARIMPIDDMEDYDRINRVDDAWKDGRADTDNTAEIRLLDLGNRALRLQYALPPSGGRCFVSRRFDPPRNWSAFETGALTMLVRGGRHNSPAHMMVVVEDGNGDLGRAQITQSPEQTRALTWQSLDVPLAAFGALDWSRIQRILVSVVAPAGEPGVSGRIDIDELALRLPPDATGKERETPTRVKTGSVADIRGCPPVYETADVDADADTPAPELRADVCVVGGGSGGIGTAIAAAREGATVILVEKQSILGGTSTAAYITNWEPGPGCDLAREIHDRLTAYQDGVRLDKPAYDQTLTRASRGHMTFEITPFHDVVMGMLHETGRCRVLLDTMFTHVKTDTNTREVLCIRTVNRDGVEQWIRARVFVDCTGGAYLCNAAGAEMMLGVDPKSRFNEPGAPEKAVERLNALELAYRIRPRANPVRQPMPPGVKPRRGGYAFGVPSGDRMVNACGGLASGWELIEKGYVKTRLELEKRVRAHWHWLQKEKFPDYEFDSVAPMLAIRESYRTVGDYVLVEQDLLAGIEKQTHDDIIAIADHPMDTHGSGGGLGEVAAPYGIPYRCLIPRDWRNLLVACRGASFSHIAASSCRLSRTIMALGHAAGLAAFQASRDARPPVAGVDIGAIQTQLNMPPSTRSPSP